MFTYFIYRFYFIQYSQIPFTLSVGEKFDLSERHAFWDSVETRQWFQERGYTLYKRYIEVLYDLPVHEFTEPSLPFEEFRESDYPFAYHDVGNIESGMDVIPLRTFDNNSVRPLFSISTAGNTISNPFFIGKNCFCAKFSDAARRNQNS